MVSQKSLKLPSHRIFMKLLRGVDALIVVLATVALLLIGFGIIIPGFVIIGAAALVLIMRERYVLVVIILFFITINFYIASTYPEFLQIASQTSAMILSFLLIGEGYYGRKIKGGIRNVLKELNIKNLRIEIVSFEVNTYNKNLHNLKDPVFVKIWANSDVIKGYFDLESSNLVIKEPILFPSYDKTPEKIWKDVVKIHEIGTPERIEFKDKYGTLVGVEILDVTGAKTGNSWRLNKSLHETWDPVKRKWEPQPRGWKPKKSLSERLRGSFLTRQESSFYDRRDF